MRQQSNEQDQQDITSIEPSILTITEEELQSVFGGTRHQPSDSYYTDQAQTKLPKWEYFIPSHNNPTAGDIYNQNGNRVGIRLGDCSAGPC